MVERGKKWRPDESRPLFEKSFIFFSKPLLPLSVLIAIRKHDLATGQEEKEAKLSYNDIFVEEVILYEKSLMEISQDKRVREYIPLIPSRS